jgi:3'-phosphoadenosine 5'-phosphosulfate sulfotransferase (PAPS reductase)/FAD synthetase
VDGPGSERLVMSRESSTNNTHRIDIETHNVVSMSGGKDSTAMALLAREREAENLSYLFADTGHEHQQTYDYIDYLEQALDIEIVRLKADFTELMAGKRKYIQEHWADDGVSQEHIDEALSVLRPTGIPMLDLCLWKGRMPSTRARFCSEKLKHDPLDKYMTDLLAQPTTSVVISWQGVRRDESHQRANLVEEEDHPTQYGLRWYRPILDWTADDCFAMHKRHGIKHNPLYEQGQGRVGCMPCIHSRKDELAEIGRRFPEEIERLARWEALASKASKQGNTMWYDARITARFLGTDRSEVHYSTHGIHTAVRWANGTRGQVKSDGVQMELIATDAPTCKSIYGLCE